MLLKDKIAHFLDPSGHDSYRLRYLAEAREIAHYFYENYGGKEVDSALVSMIPIVDIFKDSLDSYYGEDIISRHKLTEEDIELMYLFAITPFYSRAMNDVADVFTDAYRGISKVNFGSAEKLAGHFAKYGDEFKGIYKNADEYLAGARDVMQNGTKVSYTYKDEIRTGYLRFMGNNSKGVAKFEFVGTNNLGEITTYHVESGKTFWKMLMEKIYKLLIHLIRMRVIK